MRRVISTVILLALAILSTSVFSVSTHAQGPFSEGQHYSRLADPVRTVNPNKIEVVEVFSYDCPHCMAFEPLIQPWKAQLPEYVVFVAIQAPWNAYLEKLGRAQLTAKALKVEDKVHPAIYTAIQVPGQRPGILNDAEIKKLFTINGVDGDKFDKAFNSFGINSQVKQNKEKVDAYKITSTPQLVVNGEYVISATREIDHQAMLDIADFLVQKIRSERGLE